ncbi:hypothetical protein MHK_004195, partial [Candidatus Magnetomorum sp. HK-1]
MNDEICRDAAVRLMLALAHSRQVKANPAKLARVGLKPNAELRKDAEAPS